MKATKLKGISFKVNFGNGRTEYVNAKPKFFSEKEGGVIFLDELSGKWFYVRYEEIIKKVEFDK